MMNVANKTLTEISAKIETLHTAMLAADDNGLEVIAEVLHDAAWDLMVVRQSMRKAREINLRTRLAR